ncbi:MAG: PAAR domain-containing protein [Proteobacteria bacterium]|nr:PAAR domain-containing protein [Pseudomonadota bacterium]
MSKPAARLSDDARVPADTHGCPHCAHPCVGPIIDASNDVFINGLGAARVGDPGVHSVCCGPNTYKCAEGSPNVFVNGKAMVRKGDKTEHCGGDGQMIMGSPNVFCN